MNTYNSMCKKNGRRPCFFHDNVNIIIFDTLNKFLHEEKNLQVIDNLFASTHAH